MKQFKRCLSLLLILAMLLPLVYVGPIALPTEAATSTSYTASTYASSLSVKTTKNTTLMEGPSTAATSSYTIAKDTMLTVKALHKNTSGAYWYEVLYYNKTLFVDATATTLVDHLTGDVTISGVLSPWSLGTGQGFPIEGTITSSLNKLGKVTASVHYNSNIHKTPAITSSDTVSGSSYSLEGSNVDNNLIFSDLAAGSYTYMLTVEAISYYINSSGALTTSTQTVVLDNHSLVVTTANVTNPITATGIDVSTWQGSINWASVASQVDFAILRIGYSTTLDDTFATNAAGCNANGIPFGVYLYSYATTEAAAIAEANFVISALKNYDVDMPIFFDIEDSSQVSLGATALQNIVKAFCNTIRDAGYTPGLYTMKSWFDSYFTDSYYCSMPKWVAHVDVSTTSYSKGMSMWQYSWTGSISGISGDVDMNYYFGEFMGNNSDSSYLKNCTYYPSNLDVTVTAAGDMNQYPSSDYAVVGSYAVGETLHVTGVYKNAYGNFWYQVEKDGVTGYVWWEDVTVKNFRYDDLSVVDPTMADNLAVGAGYYLRGELRSVYNSMSKVNAKVYAGEDTTATPMLSSSDSTGATEKKEYNLYLSDVCDNTIFSDLDAGYYTYEISADVTNYYVSNNSAASETENVVLWTAPYTVGGAAITPPASVACTHTTVDQPAVAPTCTATGLTAGSYCSKCGEVFTAQTVVPATGHSYTGKIQAATCKEYEILTLTCSGCKDVVTVNAGSGEWFEIYPEGVDAGKVETKTQYRYSDYETKTSYNTSMSGYSLKTSAWEKSGSGTVNYVNTWPSGYYTSHATYASYNNKASKKTASETTTDKTVIDSDAKIGYLWYHWCASGKTTSVDTKDDTYTSFHAFYSTSYTPDNADSYDSSDGSYKLASSTACSNCVWFWPVEVYAQKYTTYKKLFTYERWTDYSAWSDTAVTASSTRKVETRTLYRYTNAELGEHNYVSGVCTVCSNVLPCDHLSHDTSGICSACGVLVEHTYVGGECSVCGKVCGHPGHDTEGLCGTCGETVEHTFVDGVCSCGKVQICAHASHDANGVCAECGETVGHTYVGGKCSVCGEVFVCSHPSHSTEGICGTCGTSVNHVFVNGTCSVCGKEQATGTITPFARSVSFKDEPKLIIYFKTENLDEVPLTDMGLLTWSVPQVNGTIDTAGDVISGVSISTETEGYKVLSNGIPAKKLGDTVYFKVYAKLADGSYVYSELLSTSPKAYAMSMLNKSTTSTGLKALLVSMLNYGAAAQECFGYKVYNLVNADLTEEQKALVLDYDSTMVSSVPGVGSKGSDFVYTSAAFTRRIPSVNFGSAFAINYFFTPAYPVDGEMTMYYWDAETVASADKLTAENANGSVIMELRDGAYCGTLTGFAARQINDAVYVAGVYQSGGVTYTTGVLPYSLGLYCKSIAANDGNDAQELAQRTAVYGYYAKAYFG